MPPQIGTRCRARETAIFACRSTHPFVLSPRRDHRAGPGDDTHHPRDGPFAFHFAEAAAKPPARAMLDPIAKIPDYELCAVAMEAMSDA